MTRGPVWIDLANSPHVLFFNPVVDELRRRGMEPVVTARDFAQTLQLCDHFGVNAEVIGHHGGASLSGKARELTQRVRLLRAFARRMLPCVAVSHNAYAQTVAARSLGVPVVTAMDYEYQPANHLAFRCADLVVVPDVFPLDHLRAQGARPRKTWRYPGLKEHIALAGFRPDRTYLDRNGIDSSRPVIVVRPPADMALYHRFQNPLFPRLLERLATEPVTTILLARTESQTDDLEAVGFGGLVWRGGPLDGRELAANADVVVSAGGSMNREAAVLGTPAYSIYVGKLAAVDRALVAQGRLHLLQSEADITRLPLQRRAGDAPPQIGQTLVIEFVDRLLEVARR
jgi:predicted glycosyltransferase